MPEDNSPQLSHTAAMVLSAIAAGHEYGFSVIEITGLASGTVYPALRRLERDGLISSKWEPDSVAEKAMRPPRRYYTITPNGTKRLEASKKRYPLLEKLFAPAREANP